MTRYDLIVKKVDGCASARVEKHELGSFVKYVDVMEHIAELENIINAQVFPSSGDGFSSEYIKGYEEALGDLYKMLKEQE